MFDIKIYKAQISNNTGSLCTSLHEMSWCHNPDNCFNERKKKRIIYFMSHGKNAMYLLIYKYSNKKK